MLPEAAAGRLRVEVERGGTPVYAAPMRRVPEIGGCGTDRPHYSPECVEGSFSELRL
ncbi:MAG: hypothetical protein AVDCRST_MAG12-204 [uncultured Rubrobacteraceae bacterium]|uniref:Uncharacterized protein n=1 Tax=uncultured Rubrobacteraceae bacterium TaxID=349277 RepID=A0A6J4R7F6_9ACTN|nr:MAG: hypothetical protein AVDCRST_MAG12-204 [uncultured Rubrobacteraceae bacterium]